MAALGDMEGTFIDPAQPLGTRVPFPSVWGAAEVELSVVVPAYNEQARLPAMLDETCTYLSDRSLRAPAFTWEVIIVDDGSRDGTADVAMRYVKAHGASRVRLLCLRANAGKGAAVRRGALCTRGRFVLMADADAATAFADIERLEHAVSEHGVDVAVGSRAHLRNSAQRRGFLRNLASRVFNLVVVHVGGVSGISDTQCGFKLFSRDAARVAFAGQHLDRWAFDVENLFRCQKAGLLIVEVPVAWTEVPGSKLSVLRATVNMVKDMLRMRLHYSLGSWALAPPAAIGPPLGSPAMRR